MQTTGEQTLAAINRRRGADGKLVFTNGCFDILHVGHLRYLTQAKALGDLLVVGVNSDASVRRLKGESRPIVSEEERLELLLGLRAVDFVCLFDEETPLRLIKEVRPDILVKGGDWPVEEIVGHEFVASTGGVTRSLPFVEGKSTTNIIEKISAIVRAER
jgi:D-beta-D-heptose 7-phosphate kinase/D-beta-D-heptose 1-phosphate adenosyltransferase